MRSGSADSIGASRQRICIKRPDIELQPEIQNLHSDLVTGWRPYRTSMDAPINASFSSHGSAHVVRCCRLSGLLLRQLNAGRWPVWRYADRVQIAYASFNALRSDAGFPDPVSMTVCPYSSSDLLTSPTTSPVPPFRQPGEPGSSPSSSSVPTRCAPSGWLKQPRRASSACAPACRPTTDPRWGRVGPRGARPSWRR